MPLTLQQHLEDWKKSFGGGMIPFDNAYWEALGRGDTPAQAQTAGVHELLDSFVYHYEKRLRGGPNADMVEMNWKRNT